MLITHTPAFEQSLLPDVQNIEDSHMHDLSGQHHNDKQTPAECLGQTLPSEQGLRELERALKHFHDSLDASGVFKTFLHHVGIDTATYVRQVRPNL